ncbi:MAG: M48 family metalloprotease, partial [Alistipes sp.]|nr:M48 family metalloprotease [Alistipes sp.]
IREDKAILVGNGTFHCGSNGFDCPVEVVDRVHQRQDGMEIVTAADGFVLGGIITGQFHVIGHEIGHVEHHDSKKAFRTALLTSALRDGIASSGGKVATLTDSQLGDLGEALVNARHSQQQERAADDYGYEFLKQGGKNPWAMALSFRRLKQLQEEAGVQKSSKLNQLFATHPDLDERIKRMEQRATAENIVLPESETVAAAK